MAIIEGVYTSSQSEPVPFALRHALALDLALLLAADRPSWWERLLGRDQREAIADLLEGVAQECAWDWVGRPKSLGELWTDIHRKFADAYSFDVDEWDWLAEESVRPETPWGESV